MHMHGSISVYMYIVAWFGAYIGRCIDVYMGVYVYDHGYAYYRVLRSYLDAHFGSSSQALPLLR